MSAIRRDEILFRGGGAELLRSGVTFPRFRRDGSEPEAPTFTRADVGSFQDKDGIVRYAGANKLRPHWDYVTGRLTLLCEPARTNVCLQANVAGTTWGNTDVTGSANTQAAPDGAVTADRLVEAATTGTHFNNQTFAGLTDSTVYCFSRFVRPWVGRDWVLLATRSKDNTLRETYFNVTTGIKGTGNHIASGIIAYPSGWYRVWGSQDVASGVTTPEIITAIAEADNDATFLGDTGKGISVWGGQVEAGYYPTSPIDTTTGPVARAADALTDPIGFGAHDITVYVRLPRPVWADISGALPAEQGVLALGYDGTNGALIYGTAGSRAWTAWIGGQTAAVNIPAGTSLEICAQFRYATDAKCCIDVGAGFSSLSTATANASFGNNTALVGRVSTGTELGGGIERLLVARGLRTLAECQAVYG